MEYSFRLPDPNGPFTDEAGENYRFVSPVFSKRADMRGYYLMLEGVPIGQISRVRSSKGWHSLPIPWRHRDHEIWNDGDPQNDIDFKRINTWVGPFADRHAAMEYILWTLGYIESMGM
jgi:hypothetical protein